MARKLAFIDELKKPGKNSFPYDGLPNEKKQEPEYFLAAAKAIVSRYVCNVTEIPYSAIPGRESIHTIRQYCSGDQGVEGYKDILIGRKNQNNCRPDSTMNINWKTMDILPKKLGDVEGYLRKIKYTVGVTAIDRQAVQARETVKAMTKLSINNQARLLHQDLNAALGQEVVQQDPELAQQPESLPFINPEQVEKFAENGGIQLEQEIAVGILNEKTEEISGSDVLENMLIRDQVQIGIRISKQYQDKGSFIVKERYVDPEFAILPHSKFPDFRDATYFGELRRMSIYQLRTESDLSEADLIKIAKMYNDADHNKHVRVETFYLNINDSRENGLGLAVLDSIEVDVADVVWLGTKGKRQTRIVREKDGGLSLNTVDDRYNLKESDKRKGKELKEYSTQTVYKAKYIVGTDFIFDYGEEKNIAFEKTASGRRVAVLPFSAYREPGKSMGERCIGFVDDLHIALFKKRMAIKNLATGPNIMIKKSALENVTIGGKKQSPASLMKLYRDEGFLIVDDDSPFDTRTSQSRPIDVIPTDTTRQLLACREEIQDNTFSIEEVTGVNQVFSGSTPKSEQGLGVSQIAVNATENSIYILVDAAKKHREAKARIRTHMWKVSATYMTDKEREALGISRSLKAVAIGKDIAEFDYDTKLEAGITEQEMQAIVMEITQLADYRRQAGSGGLSPSDKMLLLDILKNGNLKQARLALSQIEEFRAMEDERIAQQRYQENAKLQQDSNQQATDNKMAEIDKKGEVDANIELLKLDKQIELEKVKGDIQRKATAAANVYGWGLQAYQEGAKAR